jgi:GT2 family glycosyltransferase
MARVDVHIVTFNSANVIDACLESVRRQGFPDFAITVIDNGSSDGTVEQLRGWQSLGVHVILNTSNELYSRVHNRAIRASQAEYVLVLNPDVIIAPDYLSQVVGSLSSFSNIGSVNGRLIRAMPYKFHPDLPLLEPDPSAVLDGAGLIMHRSFRPNLRGNNEPAASRFLTPEYIFGVDGACALYRRAMLDDVAIQGEYFDEDFGIYREDVDLAWRAQLLGWDCLYLPAAVAFHIRSIRPGQSRWTQSRFIKRHSVKNGWLLVIKNAQMRDIARNALFVLVYQARVLLGVLFIELTSISAVFATLRLLPRMLRKRREIRRRRRRSAAEMRKWFV